VTVCIRIVAIMVSEQ